jgi:hypothetical protein
VVKCGRGETYFANVDESAHEVLVAKGVDSVLCLVPSCVFHNSTSLLTVLSVNHCPSNHTETAR